MNMLKNSIAENEEYICLNSLKVFKLLTMQLEFTTFCTRAQLLFHRLIDNSTTVASSASKVTQLSVYAFNGVALKRIRFFSCIIFYYQRIPFSLSKNSK